jgi:hypothetical protein
MMVSLTAMGILSEISSGKVSMIKTAALHFSV